MWKLEKRPDIAFAVCQLSRHLEKPSEEHWNAAIRMLHYLKSTATNGIWYQGKSGEIKLNTSVMLAGEATR